MLVDYGGGGIDRFILNLGRAIGVIIGLSIGGTRKAIDNSFS